MLQSILGIGLLLCAAPPAQLPLVEATKTLNDDHFVVGVACAPDGKNATCLCDRHDVREFDPVTGKIGKSLFRTERLTQNVIYVADGKYLVAVGGEVVVWDVAAEKVVDTVSLPAPKPAPLIDPNATRPPQPPVSTALPTVSLDGKRIYIRNEAGEIVVRDTVERKDVGKLPTAGNILTQLVVSPDGTKLAVVSKQSLSVWNTKTLKPLAEFKFGSYVVAVEFNADNNTLFGVGLTNAAKPPFYRAKAELFVCDVAKGERIKTVEGSSAIGLDCHIHLDPARKRAYLETTGSPQMVVIDPKTGKELGVFIARFGPIRAFTTDGKRLLGSANRVLYWVEVAAIREAIGDKE